MKKNIVLLVFGIFLMASCSKENEVIDTSSQNQSVNELQSKMSARYVGTSNCFNIFSNQDYDCGWTDGYKTYVNHYNQVKDMLGYGDCFTVTVAISTSTEGNTNPDDLSWQADPSFYTASVSTGYIIPNRVKTEFQQFYNSLYSNQNSSDYAKGKFNGYSAFRGKEPLSTAENCLSGNGYVPPFN